jgi:hypothetical protein
MADEECKRTMTCKCKECVAANAAFSVDDLKQFSSKIDYGADTGDAADSNENAPPPMPLKKGACQEWDHSKDIPMFYKLCL